MRRIAILFFWVVGSKNNVSLLELIRFCLKPRVKVVAEKYIKEIVKDSSDFKVSFHVLRDHLYWPISSPIEGIYQVTSETFDEEDWHYYQKDHSEVREGDVLLDIGAAEGLFALSVIDKCKKILLIEPNDSFVNSLKRTFSNYTDKIEIFNVAVGSVDGKISFDQNSLNGRVVIDASSSNQKEMWMIDHLLPVHTKISYLKADLEGFEVEMLKGAKETILRNRPRIAITSYHPENEAKEIIDLVKGFVPHYNYYVKGISQTKGKPVMIHFWAD